MEVEIWKNIPEYEGYCQVSSLGRVKSLDRYIKHNNGIERFLKGRILIPTISKYGYLRIGLNKEGKSKILSVHQLVAIAFHKHTPCGHKVVVDHKDFNRQNNHKDNLRIITARENTNLKHIKSSSIHVGVSWKAKNKKWVAQIWVDAVKIHLGLFDSERKASKAYNEALLMHNQGKSIQPVIDKYKVKNSSNYQGVSWHDKANKWLARIWINGKSKYIGTFINEYEAHLAYQKAIKEGVKPH